jgi:Tol biopolymer transport system component
MLYRKSLILAAHVALVGASAACSDATSSPPTALPSAPAEAIEAFRITRSVPRIAFSSDSANRPAIFTMNPDGSDVRKLTAFDFSSLPAWAADGRRLAFVRDPVDALPLIMVMQASGHGAHVLTDGSNPKWHHNGKTILFTRFVGIEDQRLFRIDLDGTNFTRIPGATEVQGPGTWADELTVAYGSSRGGTYEIWLVTANGNHEPQKLTDCAAEGLRCGQPAASPVDNDGRIALIAFGPDKRELRILNRRTGAMTTLLSDPLLVTDPPTWSPDAATLVFTSGRVGGTPQLFAINADGRGQPVQLTFTTAKNHAPAWQR